MADSESEKPAPASSSGTPWQMLFVLLVVFIICGGNGAGIITAALIWKYTRRVALTVVSVVGITTVAVAVALLVIFFHRRSRKES